MSIVLQPSVEERLRSNKMVWLTTVRPDGRPHTVPVWFLWNGAELLIWSKPRTRKIANMRHNSAVTLALDDSRHGFDVVVLEGSAELLGKGEEREFVRAFGEKYHEGLQRIGVPAEAFVMLYAQPIRITPARVYTGH